MRTLLRQILEPIRKNGVLDVPTAMAKGRVHSVPGPGGAVRWLITNSNDEIQHQQLRHGYYERRELTQLLSDVGPQASIVDIGSNIGNHAIFFAKNFGCRRLLLVEPYPPAIQHLLVNTALNYSPCFDYSLLGHALGRADGSANLVEPTRFNIGLTKVNVSEGGTTPVIAADRALADRPIDLIKVDVEGMELEVMAGLAPVLERQRPILYIEVNREHRDQFFALLDQHRYRPLREAEAGSQSNFTCIPG